MNVILGIYYSHGIGILAVIPLAVVWLYVNTCSKGNDIVSFQATFDYMELVRKTIQNDNFKSLLSLSFGSALAIALDRSGSMDEERAAVEAQITEIIKLVSTGKTPWKKL